MTKGYFGLRTGVSKNVKMTGEGLGCNVVGRLPSDVRS